MLVIPLAATPSQTLDVRLGVQYCKIKVYEKSTGVYLDLSVAGVPVVTGIICRDRVKLVDREHLGFSGDLAFVDTQGTSDPTFDGMGSRYILAYIEPGDA